MSCFKRPLESACRLSPKSLSGSNTRHSCLIWTGINLEKKPFHLWLSTALSVLWHADLSRGLSCAARRSRPDHMLGLIWLIDVSRQGLKMACIWTRSRLPGLTTASLSGALRVSQVQPKASFHFYWLHSWSFFANIHHAFPFLFPDINRCFPLTTGSIKHVTPLCPRMIYWAVCSLYPKPSPSFVF